MTEKKIFAIDRFEGDKAVCISDNDDVVVVLTDTLGGLMPRDIFAAYVEDGGFKDITPMPEERDRRLDENRARLQALAKRSRK